MRAARRWSALDCVVALALALGLLAVCWIAYVLAAATLGTP